MLTEDLAALLTEDADAAGAPPAGLLDLVRRRAARQQRRRAAALGVCGVLAAGGLVTGALTIDRGHTTVLRAAGAPTTAPSPVADPECADPGALPPSRYLDWPCAKPADADTRLIVAKLMESVRAAHPGIKDPQVRLLADTRGITDPFYGPAATLIEEWDGGSSGPAVVAYGAGPLADQLRGGDSGSGYADAGDPGMFHGAFSTDDGVQDVVLFARAGIASVSLSHDGTVTSAPFTGGATAISVKAGDISVSHPSYTYAGLDGSGATVSTISYDSIFLAAGFPADPCSGLTSGTCSSRGTGPAPGSTTGGASLPAVAARPASTDGSKVPSPVPASAESGSSGATQVPSPVPASPETGSSGATQVPSPSPTP